MSPYSFNFAGLVCSFHCVPSSKSRKWFKNEKCISREEAFSALIKNDYSIIYPDFKQAVQCQGIQSFFWNNSPFFSKESFLEILINSNDSLPLKIE